MVLLGPMALRELMVSLVHRAPQAIRVVLLVRQVQLGRRDLKV